MAISRECQNFTSSVSVNFAQLGDNPASLVPFGRLRIALLEPAALFVFRPTAAVAEVIPANLRLIAAKWLMRHLAIDEGPGSSFFAESRDLVVLDLLILLGVCRDKLDGPLGVLFFSASYFEYLKTIPLGSFGPFEGALAIELSPGAGMEGSLDEVDVCGDVSGIPRAHQSFCRRGISYAGEKRFTTLTEWSVTSAGAIGHLFFLS